MLSRDVREFTSTSLDDELYVKESWVFTFSGTSLELVITQHLPLL